jgi:3-oxoacyl-[acyl-carrier protein] reductase
MSEEHIKYMLSKIPWNRFLKVEEAASMVTWLCSSENSFTTGVVFNLSEVRATYWKRSYEKSNNWRRTFV